MDGFPVYYLTLKKLDEELIHVILSKYVDPMLYNEAANYSYNKTTSDLTTLKEMADFEEVPKLFDQ